MDKNAIKKYAVWARRELIDRVAQKAAQYGITEKEIIDANADSIRGRLLSEIEKKQRKGLIAQINEKGYEQVMEEVAYTWFNRFIALRFMEVNGYLPSHVRVFTDDDNAFKPQILTEAIHLELEGLDMEKVYALKDANDNDELFKYLIITQCNSLSEILPGMFQHIADYTELLFPDNLLRDGSVIEQMIALIPEEDWKEQVQIIGWLYQYYNTEKKDDVFAALKKNVKITKENIPAATQLFTPDWIVRYMVENSLGRLWLEGHPNDELKAQWKYYLDEAKQEPDGEAQLAEIRKDYANITPEQIKCIDPCSGSGHILDYMFDVLMQIYEAYGYTTREAVASIVENNIYGLDIDDRAAQLAYFSIMMKARQYDRRFFSRGIQPHVYGICESNHIHYNKEFGDFLLEEKHRDTLRYLLEVFRDAKEYGSILEVEQRDYIGFLEAWKNTAEATLENVTMIGWYMYANEIVVSLAKQAIALSQKYDVVVTNPPYMGASGMNAKLSEFIKTNYADYKSDFFSAFVVKCSQMAKSTGKLGFFTPYVWMFIQSYEKMRQFLYSKTIETLIQFEYSAFEEATVPVCTFAFSNNHVNKKGCYLRLTEFRGGMEVQRQKTLEAIGNHDCGFYFEQSADNFSKIPGSPVAYWASDALLYDFVRGISIKNLSEPKSGLSTTDNSRFLRYWYEVVCSNISFSITDICQTENATKWYPMAKGGEYRKWYGNNEYVVDWENNGTNIREATKGAAGGRIVSPEYYFKEFITWSGISSGEPSMRISNNAIFGSGAKALLSPNNLYEFLALLNSKVSLSILKFLSPTLNYEAGHIGNIPVCFTELDGVYELTKESVAFSKSDWDAYETSWDFQRNPLIDVLKIGDATTNMSCSNIKHAYGQWKYLCNQRFVQLKANEEELNRIFIDIYGLQDELTPEVADKDVTVHFVVDSKDDIPESLKGSNYVRTKRDEIVSLISYAVGCMFGRYSLDEEGLAYAGGTWDESKYKTFTADKDAIIPICDDEYFDDDIVGRFVEFMEIVFGEDMLEENLQFIADALGGKGTSREVIRNYFMNDFYADHLKTYQKRPIYWLFDSGKKNGFKCLIYMQRYQPDTIARIRTDYVHEQQSRYRTATENLERRIAGVSTSERVKLNKQLKTLQDKQDELHTYEEKIHHLADQMISIDLDDGVKHNYAIFQDVLAKIK
jgi:hypothetical protein